MQGASEFAHQVREHDRALQAVWRCVTYPIGTAIALVYLWPLIAHFRCGGAATPTPRVKSRAVNGPLVLASIGFAGWVAGAVVFPAITLVHFGHWSADLASQHVLSPVVNGFLA